MEERPTAVRWRVAMARALYGPDGFYARPGPPRGGGGHFRTSAHASPLFANALLRLVVAADESLGRPDPLDIVDIGAGGGHLLRRLATLAPTYLANRLRLRAVELAPRPAALPERIGWQPLPPPAGSVQGVVVATEWLDNVPLDVAVPVGDVLHYALVERDGTETVGDPVVEADAAWTRQWWPGGPDGSWPPGCRVELGAPRDEAWAGAVAILARGLALTVDYGHTWSTRPPAGTLTGFYAGREVPAVPDGTTDLTAHVAMDSACAAGEAVAGREAVLLTQREALTALGVDGRRPPLALAARDPDAYVRALSAATQAAELTDLAGLGAHYWIVQPVGVALDTLPAGLR